MAFPLGKNRARSPSSPTWIEGRWTGDPSGRTARRGTLAAVPGPAYTIKLPSGEHTGATAVPATRRTGEPPSSGILNSPGPLASEPPVRIHFLSDDQQFTPWIFIESAVD